MHKPRMIDHEWTALIQDDVDTLLTNAGLALPRGWRVYVTRARRGQCALYYKYARIPTWVFDHDDSEYYLYYLAHELAHIYAGRRVCHGTEFMQWFKNICPPHLWHHELGYKPRLATAAGIRKEQS